MWIIFLLLALIGLIVAPKFVGVLLFLYVLFKFHEIIDESGG